MKRDRSPKTKKHLVSKGEKDLQNGAIQEQQELVKIFCQDLIVEDISFKEWVGVHKKLDITVREFISQEEGRVGGERECRYSRKIQSPSDPSSRKEKTSYKFSWPQNTHSSFQIEAKGFGDVQGTQSGNLLILVQIN